MVNNPLLRLYLSWGYLHHGGRLTGHDSKISPTGPLLGGSSQGLGYVVNNHGVRRSLKDRVIPPSKWAFHGL